MTFKEANGLGGVRDAFPMAEGVVSQVPVVV